ncbi:MAG: hypothetical protein HY661_07510 [Betaproteobacteria bacterium]|nr:hypothetical protein [Betaproteobacteria bacterium]
MKTNFLTNQYELTHRHLPRGRGGWLFEVTCKTALQKSSMMEPQFHGIVRVEASPEKIENLILVPVGSCTYSEAKARVKHFLRGHFTEVDIDVCA